MHRVISNDTKAADLIVTCYAASLQNRFIELPDMPVPLLSIPKILHYLPSMEELAKMESDEMIRERIGDDAYKFLEALLVPHLPIVTVPEANRTKGIEAEYECEVVVQPEGKKEKFQEREEKYGSKLLLHGTILERIYPILLNGLKIFTEIPLVLHGHVYGPAIHLSKSISTCYGYSLSKEFNLYRNSIFRDAHPIILCKGVNSPDASEKSHVHIFRNEDDCIVERIFINVNEKGSQDLSND